MHRAACQGLSTGGSWSQQESQEHINVLELREAMLAIWTFTRRIPSVKNIRMQDSTVALCYLIKMGETRNRLMSELSKEI